MSLLHSFSKTHLYKQRCYRLIPSKFPPIPLFEDVANETDFVDLYAIQALTNPRIQEEVGFLSLVPEKERLFGVPGSGYVMAAFTHINPDGSRFSNGDFGIYYASATLSTAIAETVYHREQFLRYTQEPAQEIDMRSLVAEFTADLYDLKSVSQTHSLYSLSDYQAGQALGAELKRQRENGVIYHSVRDVKYKGTNFALFKPCIIHQCKQSAHYGYVWSGEKITSIYKKTMTETLV